MKARIFFMSLAAALALGACADLEYGVDAGSGFSPYYYDYYGGYMPYYDVYGGWPYNGIYHPYYGPSFNGPLYPPIIGNGPGSTIHPSPGPSYRPDLRPGTSPGQNGNNTTRPGSGATIPGAGNNTRPGNGGLPNPPSVPSGTPVRGR